MPPAEDIAWKFVIRLEGKKWRCPYCHKRSSGSVTRVRSHFLKQPKDGIASCTKVPDHIRTLMESLRNHELHNKDDIAWKFVNRVEDSKWRCYYSSGEFFGDLAGVKGHLFGVPNEGISICTGVPEHVRMLMRSLLDEEAEEESREVAEEPSGEAHGQSSVEPKSGDMPTQAEVAEEESRGANCQFITESDVNLLSSEFPSTYAIEQMALRYMTAISGVNSDQQSQPERQFHEQNSLGESSTMAPAEEVLYPPHLHQPECSIQSRMQMNDQQTLAGPSSCQYDQSTAAVQPVCQPQSVPHQSITSSVQHLLMDWLALSSLNPSEPQVSLDQVLDNSMSNELQEFIADGITQCASSPDWSTLFNSLPKSHDVNVNTSEEIQMSEVHNPTVGSSLQNDSFLDVDRTNRLQDSQLCEVEVVPELGIVSNTSLTNTVQHPNQLHPRCDKEDGNNTCLFPSRTPMDIEPSIASQHSTDSHIIVAATVDSVGREVATNTPGPSSSQDVNRGSPIMDVRSIYANNEEMGNLKQKVEELNDKEAVIKKQMEIESAASSVWKKPRLVQWLEETEIPRNSFHIIGQANGETLTPKEQVETLTREVGELIEQTTLLIEARDDTFLERKLIGEVIHRKIKLIWDRLKENHACKLGVCGMGGVGKTTIMMHIHNRLLKDATFDGVAFVIVSKDFSNYKLQSDIWKALKLGAMEDEHERKRAAKLSKHLEGMKNCVLILDDVWDHFELEEVGIPIRAKGIKLVLTTRNIDVCSQMYCQEKIEIKPLSQKEAENLFLEELGSKVLDDLEIEAVMKSIVRECAGLPIGVITMARSMRGKTEVFEWRDSLVELQESSKGQTNMERKVFMNLKSSYDHLDNPNVQQCFLSCALYPEDEFIDKFELVELFIDQGLMDGLNTRKEQYDRGLNGLNKLRNACLLEDHGSTMKMHDLIRDMALHIMGATSIVEARKQSLRISPEYWTDALEKVSMMKTEISEIPSSMSPDCPKLSTLLLNESFLRDVVIPDSFFKRLWGLKVLNLSGCDLIELPNSISDLVNLRALLLRDMELCRIPYLGNLTSLRKLDVDGCRNLEVLEGLGMLVNLRYLGLIGTRIKRLPKGTLKCLLNLQFFVVEAVIEDDITKLGALETFSCYLENVDDFSKCVRIVEQSNNLRYYKLDVDPENSKFFVEVSNVIQFGILERRVCISGWGHDVVSVGGECTGLSLIPRDVQTMTMRKYEGKTNLSDIGWLKYLEELEIEEWENLGVLCGGHDEEAINIHDSPTPTPTAFPFPNIRVLNIYECPKLKYLFGHGSKSNLPHLRKIAISECNEMVGIIAAVTSPPPNPLPFLPSLEEISVDCCDKVKRAVESEWMPHFPSLRSITISVCENMEEIIGGPTAYLPDKEISLKSLCVHGCNNMRKLFLHEWLPHLQNIQSIEVHRCRGMVEMISGAGQGQEGSIMTPVNNTPSSSQPSSISLPKLELLELEDLPQLKSICKVPISCDSMKDLSVKKCPELKGIPLQLRKGETEDLPHNLGGR